MANNGNGLPKGVNYGNVTKRVKSKAKSEVKKKYKGLGKGAKALVLGTIGILGLAYYLYSGYGAYQDSEYDLNSFKAEGTTLSDMVTDIGNVSAYLTEDDYDLASKGAFETYKPLDYLDRATEAVSLIDKSMMPTIERGSISSVYPTGWEQAKYDIVDGGWLYNRSHMIGWQLTGEDANKENLMTGTRSFNVDGMLPYENMVAEAVKDGHSILYKVICVYESTNLLADGVIMAAQSYGDDGKALEFCVFVANTQEGIGIDYKTGDSWLLEDQ